MTRKDYIAIAEALRAVPQLCKQCLEPEDHTFHHPASECKPCIAPQDHHAYKAAPTQETMACAEYIANALHADNPRFDREHFLAVVRGERELSSHPPRGAK